MSLMGLDIGTTGAKASVFDEKGRSLASAYREYPLLDPRPGWLELDPREVWRNVREAVAEAAAGAPEDPVEALAITTLGEAAVPVDRNGNILDNSILGFDNRTADMFEEWLEGQDPVEIMRITGHPPSQMYTIAKLMWVKENRPDLYDRMDGFLTFGDFAHLMMGLEPRIDYSMAARTMAFDIHRKEFSRTICESAGVRCDVFSTSVPTGTPVGELSKRAAEEVGLPPGCLVVAGSHDQPAGALGSGVTRAGVAMDATGTVECFAVAMAEPVVNEHMLRNNLACYPHAAADRYISLAFNFTGGSLFRWMRDNFGRAEIAEGDRTDRDAYDLLVEQMSDEPTDLFVVPHFTMSGTPHMDPDPVGAVIGLTLSTSRAEVLRAALEGVSYEMKLNISLLEEAGVTVDEFRAVGGGARSDFWLQLKADMFNRPVVRLEVSEGASLGMAIAAGVGAGIYDNAAQAADELISTGRVFHPDPGRAACYDGMLEAYRELYPTLRRWEEDTGYREDASAEEE